MQPGLGDKVDLDRGVTAGIVNRTCVDLGDRHVEFLPERWLAGVTRNEGVGGSSTFYVCVWIFFLRQEPSVGKQDGAMLQKKISSSMVG